MRPNRNMFEFIVPAQGSRNKSQGVYLNNLIRANPRVCPRVCPTSGFSTLAFLTKYISKGIFRYLYRQLSQSWVFTCTACPYRTAATMQASSSVWRTRILTLVPLCLSAGAALWPQRTHPPLLMNFENAGLTNA